MRSAVASFWPSAQSAVTNLEIACCSGTAGCDVCQGYLRILVPRESLPITVSLVGWGILRFSIIQIFTPKSTFLYDFY